MGVVKGQVCSAMVRFINGWLRAIFIGVPIPDTEAWLGVVELENSSALFRGGLWLTAIGLHRAQLPGGGS